MDNQDHRLHITDNQFSMKPLALARKAETDLLQATYIEQQVQICNNQEKRMKC